MNINHHKRAIAVGLTALAVSAAVIGAAAADLPGRVDRQLGAKDMAQDLYRPPDYQRPVQGVVVAVSEGESNPRHRVAITRRGEEIVVNAYLDDPSYAAVGVGEDVQIARDAGGTWRLQRRTEYRLADAQTGHRIDAGRFIGSDTDYVRILAQSDAGDKDAAVTVTANDGTSGLVAIARDGSDSNNLTVLPRTTFLGHPDANVAISEAGAAVYGGGVVADWQAGAVAVGPAGSVGAPVGVLVAPATGLPTTLELPVTGTGDNRVATLAVADLLRMATALGVYPEGVSGGTTPVVPPPAAAPAVTGLTAGIAREARRFKRDRHYLVVSWDGGNDQTVALRHQYEGVPGLSIDRAPQYTPAWRLVTQPALGGGHYALYYVDAVTGSLLQAGQSANTDSEWQYVVAVDQPITDMSVPAGVTVPPITDGVRKLGVSDAVWEKWDMDTIETIPAPGAAPRQIVFGYAKLADGYRFGDAPATE